ncbi:protein-disulfide reductase [Variovorax sp. JS1663]|nr:protein-disulfide reductase [Variovorax sp. JS1663]
MVFYRLVLAAALLASLPTLAQGTPQNRVATERTRAELLAHAPEGVEPGKPVWVGLQLAHQPEWHSYWKNSGDSGLPTRLEWSLPPGVIAGEVAWPIPRKYPIGTLINYGYADTVLLPVALTISPDFQPPPFKEVLEVKLKAQWLVCRKECIPEEGEFALSIPVRSTTALHAAAFEASFAAQPQALANDARIHVDGNTLKVYVSGLPAAAKGKQLEFFPEIAEVIHTSGDWTQAWEGATWTAQVPLSPHRAQSPAVMPLVLTLGDKGWRVEASVSGTWPAMAAPAAISPALQEALRSNAAAQQSPRVGFAAALLAALLGGLILNLMPCVFPVLAIKVIGFTKHARDQRARRLDGVAYSAGVVLSFAALGGLVAGLRAAGEQVGWGFQLQAPGFIAVLAALFTLIALNFAGVFEFGRLLPSRLASLEASHPVINAFLSGVLAVAIASPCTAPFMGAALGVAASLPLAQALAIFMVLGLGMALPYLATSWIPTVARLMPRPGGWMLTFRKFMAFPMFAAVVWLLWVLGRQSGIDAMAALLAVLLAMSMAVWTFSLQGGARATLSGMSLALLAGLLWASAGRITATGPVAARTPATTSLSADESWEPWQPGRVQKILATGRPVFVDFTAAWCVTCQYNKATTLSDPDVIAALAARNVALLRADWTLRDPAITAALVELGRSGVPVYVLYSKGAPPRVLSEILSPSEVHAALAAL